VAKIFVSGKSTFAEIAVGTWGVTSSSDEELRVPSLFWLSSSSESEEAAAAAGNGFSLK
jgi:hypothetical protein